MQAGSVAALAERFGDADILINNAGATPTGPIEEATEDKWREGLELKVIATALLTRELYLRMSARRKRRDRQRDRQLRRAARSGDHRRDASPTRG